MNIDIADLLPQRTAVLETQGVPPDRSVPPEVDRLVLRAFELLVAGAAPTGVLAEVSKAEFGTVYHGEGANDPRTPVGDLLDAAEHFALFAVTLGEPICAEIKRLFGENEFALGYMLDSAASLAADNAADVCERTYFRSLTDQGRAGSGAAALRYSPGYCGWHVSGQQKLFERLNPGRIGVSLTPSFLMQPLKSVSGVVIVGPLAMHDLPDSYSFCQQCKVHSCRDRVRALRGAP